MGKRNFQSRETSPDFPHFPSNRFFLLQITFSTSICNLCDRLHTDHSYKSIPDLYEYRELKSGYKPGSPSAEPACLDPSEFHWRDFANKDFNIPLHPVWHGVRFILTSAIPIALEEMGFSTYYWDAFFEYIYAEAVYT